MSKTNFFPEEVIFAASNECNLHCPHCFITRKPIKLSSQDAIHFLESCKGSTIRQIGFSGGEPFLQLDFLLDVIKYAVDKACLSNVKSLAYVIGILKNWNDKGYKEIFILNYEKDDEEELHWVDDDCEVQDEYIIAWKEIVPPKENK